MPKKVRTKTFRVAQCLGPVLKAKGNAYTVIASDGECWVVSATRFTLDLQDEIEVPLRSPSSVVKGSFFIPDWASIDMKRDRQLTLQNPYDLVLQAWGKDIADQNVMLDETKPHSVKLSFNLEESDFVSSNLLDRKSKKQLALLLINFIANGCKAEMYTKTLHGRMVMMFGFSPKSQNEFYEEWFATAEKKTLFMQYIAGFVPTGDPNFSNADVEKIVRNWIIQKALPQWSRTASRAKDIKERQRLLVLLKKHGLPEQYRLPRQR